MTLLAHFVRKTFLLSNLMQFGQLVVEKKGLQKIDHSVFGLAAEVFNVFEAGNVVEPVKLDSCLQAVEGPRKTNYWIRLDVQQFQKLHLTDV